MGFLEDVRGQSAMLRELVSAYRGHLGLRLEEAARLLSEAERPALVVGMGSSLSAGQVFGPLLAAHDRITSVEDASELLHYGVGTARAAGVVIAVSQSGRSVETVRVVELIRATADVPVIALVNDEESPLASRARVALPLLAGAESSVATKTYVAAVAVLIALADAAGFGGATLDDIASLSCAIDEQAADATTAALVAERLGAARALLLVGRGPALGVAQYAALTIKESAAMPAEALSGGAFRHGPLELVGTDVGLVVLAPAGATVELGTALAREVAGTGRPTWLLTDQGHAPTTPQPSTLWTTPVPDVPEALAPLACVVPLQLAAAELARVAGRQAGVTLIATKVTERE